jgi:hypothetical protein
MGIPLPALNIRPPAPTEDPLSQFGRVVALRNMLQTAPLQQQALAQQVQLGGLQVQQQQLAFQDQQKLLQIMTDPSINWEDPNAYGSSTSGGPAGHAPSARSAAMRDRFDIRPIVC